MKKKAFAFLLAAMALAFAACGGTSGGTNSPPDRPGKPAESGPAENEPAESEPEESEPAPAQEQGRSVGSGDLGSSHVEIKGAALASDYEGNPAIIITYAWTNNGDDTTSAMVSIGEKAFQDGVQLETALIMDSSVYEAGSSMKDVRPGTTIDVQCAYALTSDTSTVEFELTEWISFSDDMVTMDFEPANLA